MTYRYLVVLLFAFAACGDDDMSRDAGSRDAASDLGQDGDVARDSGPDAVSDGGNGGNDGESPDGGMANPWAWCPGQDAYRGDDGWTQHLTAEPVMRCVGYSEGGTLADSRARKARVWIVPGDYGVPPRQAASGDFALPICTEIATGAGPAMTGSGTFVVTDEDGISTLNLATGRVGATDFEVSFRRDNAGLTANQWPDDLTLNEDVEVQGATFATNTTRVMQPCDLNEGFEIEAVATFAGGSIGFSYRGIAGSVSTGPAGSFHVTGNIDGTAIDITDYFRIFYVASHHHFGGGAFAVLFDAPIRGACGFRMDTRSEAGEAMLIDCDLATVELLEATFEVSF